MGIKDYVSRRVFKGKRPLKTNPELLRRLRKSAEEVKAMSPEEYEAMCKAQAKSWSRQDID